MSFDYENLTPVMQQYVDIKNQHKDSILFFRLGDFYEMFFEDAITVSKELDITLTCRNKKSDNPIPMAGVPYHAAAIYINRLIKKGFKISVCEQVSLPNSKDIVKREVVRTITPGTLIEEDVLEMFSSNYLCSVYQADFIYISYCDLSTGEFYSTRTSQDDFMSELFKINPAEILYNIQNVNSVSGNAIRNNFYSTNINIDNLEQENNYNNLLKKIKNKYEKNNCLILLNYLEETQKSFISNIKDIVNYSIDKYVYMDISAQRNLEITMPLNSDNAKSTLFNVLNYTKTAMGARKFRNWILNPLKDIEEIKKRHDFVNDIFVYSAMRRELEEKLNNIKDIERIINRLTLTSASPRDLNSLKDSLNSVAKLKKSNIFSDLLCEFIKKIPVSDDISIFIENSIVDEPSAKVSDGGFIKKGFCQELDELRQISKNSKQWLAALEQQERNKTGIKNLKVSYNKVSGYFIEISKSNIDKVPDEYIRKSTMTNAERYFTSELKDKEAFILGAKEKIQNLEEKLFSDIKVKVLEKFEELKQIAENIAVLDCFFSMAECAYRNNYVRPEMSDKEIIDIRDGRHPVVEKVLKDDFIPNDCLLNREHGFFHIITGPNMAGKSTYIRQIAIIVIMAQTGCFVPASYACIGVMNKIFTRIGASDNLTMGQSTFMVEMMETADILKGADNKSLVILDEIGRGTSTYDGLSIAWAISEYLATTGAFSMFATHYHELTEIEENIKGVKNFNVAIIEEGNELVFLHKIISGRADRSYGIHVAKLAGVPHSVIKRAEDLLSHFEDDISENNNSKKNKEFVTMKFIETKKADNNQLDLFGNTATEKYFKYGEMISVIDDIKNIDINSLTPLNALNRLNKLKNKIRRL
ncbi:MAG: DNA mismatch repair protein MutS [Candidatus Muirbacterium halophilum]|nr:DNA mismatch repair protein MutS [Candidatus Muirbacterium halophilum]MCK9476941.1 DNA mismatch repair protein MutS [Candidatus Muirbacterium halophilum]